MATLIGDGGHGRDIKATLPDQWAWAHDHEAWRPDNSPVILGINDPQARERVALTLRLGAGQELYWVHPDAVIGPSCSWGRGTHINYGVTMTRTTIGHHTTISPGVTICGDVTIGNRVMVGAGATIINRLTIGDDAIIGAGAVVLHDIGPGETWVGNPAKRIR